MYIRTYVPNIASQLRRVNAPEAANAATQGRRIADERSPLFSVYSFFFFFLYIHEKEIIALAEMLVYNYC